MVQPYVCCLCEFHRCGDVKRVIMGLDRFKKTPCGFCFVEYYERGDAEHSMAWVNGTKLDDRIIRTDWDAGKDDCCSSYFMKVNIVRKERGEG